MKQSLSHLDHQGHPRMVDVSEKAVTRRAAIARCEVRLPAAALAELLANHWRVAKGPVIDTAIIAGTQAVKRTHELIPFCHALPIESCRLSIEDQGDGTLRIECEVGARARTGVEMEALTGASVAALTVYDMCKSLGHDMSIGPLRVVSKSGGTRDFAQERG